MTLNGHIVQELGTRVPPDARIAVDGAPIAGREAHRYVALNKPVGIVSSARAERGRRSVVDLVGARERLYAVGRLDVDSEGLVLLTNDGEWAERVLHPRYGHEREYEARVSGPLTEAVVRRLRRGVRLEEGVAHAAQATLEERDARGGLLRVVLRTGWKRQVRRMCAGVGLRVDRLLRIRIGPLRLARLGPGQWRELTPREVAALAAPARDRGAA